MGDDENDRSRSTPPGLPEIDEELVRLRERLGALHASVEGLGREEPEPPPSPTVAIPAGGSPVGDPRPPAPGPPPAAVGHPAPSPAPGAPPAVPPAPPPRPAAPPPPPAGGPHAPPAPAAAPAAPSPPAAPPPLPADSGAAAVGASFVVVDAGPLGGLAAARRLEDALAELPVVREVRLRRFGRRRAELEVGLSAPHALAPELPMLEPAVEVEARGRDRLVLRVAEPREPAGAGR
jgi:hypothetical protein